MNSIELLNRIKKRDMDAYLQLTRDYGWKLYSYLRAQCDNKEMVDAVFDKTMKNFYDSLTADDSEDPVEAILYAYADHTCEQMHWEETAPSKISSVGFVLGILILGVGILAALWVILGLLMDMNLIPELDLGYSWFNANVASWF